MMKDLGKVLGTQEARNMASVMCRKSKARYLSFSTHLPKVLMVAEVDLSVRAQNMDVLRKPGATMTLFWKLDRLYHHSMLTQREL